MKSSIVKSFITGVMIGILIVMIFPGELAYVFSGGADNFVFVDFFANSPYVTSVGGKNGVMLPVEYRSFIGGISQLFDAVQYDEILSVSKVLGNNYTISDLVKFASKNFVYDESKRTLYKPLSKSFMPTEFLSVRTGVCGDYAYFYAAGVLGCCSTVTVRFIDPMNGDVGHVMAIYDTTVLSYYGINNLSDEMKIWYQLYPSGVVLNIVLSFDGERVRVVSVSMWSFSNKYTVTFPSKITAAVITYYSNNNVVGIVTRNNFTLTPPVIGKTTIKNGRVTIIGDYTYVIGNSFFAAGEGNKSFEVMYYGIGTTKFFYSFVLSPVG